MRALLLRLWLLPWPPRLRESLEWLTTWRVLQRFLVPHFMVGVVGVVWNADRHVLLLRHTYRVRYPWGLPTGFLEYGEQPAAALLREICEEAGLEVELREVWRVYTEPDRRLINVVYPGRYLRGVFRPSLEISEARFFPLDALPPILADQRILIERSAAQEVAHEGAV